MAVPTGRESDKFMLRLPDGMRERIKAAAEANNRSMNAEIVATLEEKYPAPKPESPAIVRLQSLFELFDQYVMDGAFGPKRRNQELALIKDMALKVIDKMTLEEFDRARTEVAYPGELDQFEDWPPQGWRSDGRDTGYGGDGNGNGYGDGDGAYGDSDGNGDGMGGRS